MKKIIAVLGLIAFISSASFAGMRVGVENGTPMMGWQLSKDQYIDATLSYASTNDGNDTNITLAGKYTQNFAEVKKIKLNFSGTLGLASTKATIGMGSATWTTLAIIGSLGAEYMLTDVVAVYGDIDILTIQSMSGDMTGTNIMLVSGDGNCYSGIRVYL